MDLSQARNRVFWWRYASVAVFLVAGTVFVFASLKSIYFATLGDLGLFQVIGNVVANIILTIYRHTQGLALVWRWSPALNLRHLNTADNYGFVFILCCLFVARIMWDSASSLSKRIHETIEGAEKRGWTKELMGLDQAGRPDGTKTFQVNVVSDRKDQWYKRPLGILVMGVGVAVLAQWVNLLLGLSAG